MKYIEVPLSFQKLVCDFPKEPLSYENSLLYPQHIHTNMIDNVGTSLKEATVKHSTNMFCSSQPQVFYTHYPEYLFDASILSMDDVHTNNMTQSRYLSKP